MIASRRAESASISAPPLSGSVSQKRPRLRAQRPIRASRYSYSLPHEGANNIAIALFSFPSLAAYEDYRTRMSDNPECREAYAFKERTRCILSFERSFMRPVLA